MTLGFRLKAEGAERFSGYVVKLIFLSPSNVKLGKKATADVVTRSGLVGVDGTVNLDTGETVSGAAPASLVVYAPDGAVAFRKKARLSELLAHGDIEVKPRAPIDLSKLKPAGPALRRFEGRLVCKLTQQPAKGIGVSVAVQKTGSVLWNTVFSASTNADGRFSGIYAPGEIESARLRAGATEIQSIPVSRGYLESGLSFAVFVPKDQRDCSCASEIPRAPESQDLAENGSTYSQDLSSESCMDFRLKPDRSLHEMRYWAVVRTTVPDVQMPFVSQREGAGYTVVEAKPAQTLTNKITVALDPQTTSQLETDAFLNDFESRPEVTHAIAWGNEMCGQAETVSFGHVLGFKQSWHADGYSLGELLYSLPLAPCQKKQIAIVDWDRQDRGERQESRTFEEGLVADLARDRSIGEGIASSFDEIMSGGSSAKSYSASASLGLFGGGGFLGVSAGYGGSDASAWQDSSRDLSSQFANTLHDRTMQAQTAMRRQRATVIETVSQNEDVTVQTEVVANHNHCHALTVQYFQVLRHFVVRQQLETVRECLFVPLEMRSFSAEQAHRYRDEIQPALLDRGLGDHFTALARWIRKEYNPESFAKQEVDWLDGDVDLLFQVPRPKDAEDDKYLPSAWAWLERWFPSISTLELHRRHIEKVQEKDRAFRENILPLIIENVIEKVRVTVASQAIRASVVSRNGDRVTIRFRPSGWCPVLREVITLIQIWLNCSGTVGVPVKGTIPMPGDPNSTLPWLGVNAKIQVLNANFKYKIAGQQSYRPLCKQEIGQDLVETIGDVASSTIVYLDCEATAPEKRLYKNMDAAAVVELLDHLNAHVEYYHRAIWQRMDPQRRFMLLDCYAAPHTNGRSVASVVDNELIGIVGNCLVMPVAPGISLDPRFKGQEKRDSLKQSYDPPDRLPSMRFTLPTKGVFAEAVLGNCNSCERKDDTHFWRWEESPCPDQPTAIATVDAGTRVQDVVDTKPTEFPQSIIQVQNPPAAPDPTGMAGAIAAISQPFRDMTGLTGTQQNAAKALEATLGASQTAAIKAADLLSRKMELDQLPNQMGEIERAYERGSISEEDRRRLTNDLLNNSVQNSASASGAQRALPAEVLAAAADRQVEYSDAAAGIDYSSKPAGADAGVAKAAPAETVPVMITLPAAGVGSDSELRLVGGDGTTLVLPASGLSKLPNQRVGFKAGVLREATYNLILRTPATNTETVLFEGVQGKDLAQSGFNLISKVGRLVSKIVQSLGRIEITDLVDAYSSQNSDNTDPEVEQ
jgi:hypothetical protein